MNKNNLFLFILSFVSVISLTAQIDSIYYYNSDSTKEMFYLQKDMYTFRLANGAEFIPSTASPIVAEIEHLLNSSRKMNLVKFINTATEADIQNFIATNLNLPNLEFAAKVISKDINAITDYTQDKFILSNDILMARFRDPLISQTDVDAFMLRNGLALVFAPPSTMPNNLSWTYFFRLIYTPENYQRNTIEVARKIFENEYNIISSCTPDITLKLEDDGCIETNEMAYFNNTTTKDKLWHIRNNGNNINGGASGLNDADANICECWGEGYHGEGVRIAVLESTGFDFEHPDMQGQFLDGWDCTNFTVDPVTGVPSGATPITGTIFLSNNSHGMAVSGVLAAKGSNENGDGTWAAGVAYESKIIPILRGNSSASNQLAIINSVREGAHIINMSYGTNTVSTWQPEFQLEINNAVESGIFVVASTGNQDINVTHYPAAWEAVFGVGATDPNDLRGDEDNIIPWAWSSNSIQGSNFYNPIATDAFLPYSVVAPGTNILTSTTDDPLGTPNQTSLFQWTGTSFATPLVSGIAAIMLSKNPDLLPAEVRTDVYNYNSDPNWTGYNNEMFYGRVNCPKTLAEVEQVFPPYLGIGDFVKTIDGVYLSYLNNNEIKIDIDNDIEYENLEVKIYNTTGQLVYSKTLNQEITLQVNISNLSSSIYFVHIIDQATSSYKTIKFVKK